MRTFFISGHLDLTAAEFTEHYQPLLDAALLEGAAFVVGDARGADALAQAYLAGKTARVTVYHMLAAPRHNLGQFPLCGGFAADGDRDAAMTAASTDDLAWVRPGREKSGTARNLQRRGAARPD
ncbi:MAG TPA: hypothetical protein VD886_07075 [Herpetosiphonaceae bacterium]|nr:hypothetical protein [Herpetosiphonaceae bacterium]